MDNEQVDSDDHTCRAVHLISWVPGSPATSTVVCIRERNHGQVGISDFELTEHRGRVRNPDNHWVTVRWGFNMDTIVQVDDKKPYERPKTPEQQLRDWWITQAGIETDRTVPKAIEYGSGDLIEIGRQMASILYANGGKLGYTDEEYAEMGVYFYLVGKVARWTSALAANKRVSDDTLFDIGVYVRMAQRIREAGGWPGV